VQDRNGVRRNLLYLLYSLRINTADRRSSDSEEIKTQITNAELWRGNRINNSLISNNQLRNF
jgi:hypothetical protein